MDNNNEIYKGLQPGTGLLNGKYVIEKMIGEGGFGITYRATQTGLNRAVCIKEYFLAGVCIRNTYAKTIHLQGMDESKFERFRKSFVKEAQTLAAMHHPGIVEVIDIFDENNTSYMVMPFIEGRSLQSIVEKNGPLAYPDAVNYIAQVANAVGYIHERHILHRDIKPDNIMITADNKAILIDFGSAREFEEDKTQAHTSMVTHGYAPTEQYSRTSRKGAYTDIYAIGATMYFVLTGHVPTEAAARITEPMPEPKEINPNIPDEANRTIMKALQLKSQDRHQSISEFMDDLLNVKPSGQQPEATTGTTVLMPETPSQPKTNPTATLKTASEDKPAGKEEKKGGNVKIVALIVSIVVVLGVAAYFMFLGESSTHREAREFVPKYEKMVDRCKVLISHGSGANPEKLLEAKKLFREILDAEKKYSVEMPEVYCHLSEVGALMDPKLKEAAHDWSEQAYMEASVLQDTSMACKSYQMSLSLFDDASVRLESQMCGCE